MEYLKRTWSYRKKLLRFLDMEAMWKGELSTRFVMGRRTIWVVCGCGSLDIFVETNFTMIRQIKHQIVSLYLFISKFNGYVWFSVANYIERSVEWIRVYRMHAYISIRPTLAGAIRPQRYIDFNFNKYPSCATQKVPNLRELKETKPRHKEQRHSSRVMPLNASQSPEVSDAGLPTHFTLVRLYLFLCCLTEARWFCCRVLDLFLRTDLFI